MSQAEGASTRAPSPNEIAQVRLLHAYMLNVAERLEDCADVLDAILSDLETSLCLRQEAGSLVLLCAGKLADAGAEGRAMRLLDSIQRDETLKNPSLREEADRLLLRISTQWAFRLNDLKKLGKPS